VEKVTASLKMAGNRPPRRILPKIVQVPRIEASVGVKTELITHLIAGSRMMTA
jgi:hypothetical protein